MLTFDEIAQKHLADKSSLYHGYSEHYAHRFFSIRNEPIRLLEMGIQFGQSMKLWLEYFDHPESQFFGMDIAQEYKCEDPRYKFFLCNQRDAATILEQLPLLNIVVDDAGHYASDQATAFYELWPRILPGGYYCIEDTFTLHHQYWSSPLRTGDWYASLIGHLNRNGKQFHGRPDGSMRDIDLTYLESSIDSICCYYGLIIIKKKL